MASASVPPVGDGLLRKRLDPSLDPAELCCLPQGVAGPLSSANVYRPVKSLVKTTVIGHAAMISAGEFVQMSGAWVNDRTHGQQFRASFLKVQPAERRWRASSGISLRE